MNYNTELPERAQCDGCGATFKPVPPSLSLCPDCWNLAQRKRQVNALLDFFRRAGELEGQS